MSLLPVSTSHADSEATLIKTAHLISSIDPNLIPASCSLKLSQSLRIIDKPHRVDLTLLGGWTRAN